MCAGEKIDYNSSCTDQEGRCSWRKLAPETDTCTYTYMEKGGRQIERKNREEKQLENRKLAQEDQGTMTYKAFMDVEATVL